MFPHDPDVNGAGFEACVRQCGTAIEAYIIIAGFETSVWNGERLSWEDGWPTGHETLDRMRSQGVIDGFPSSLWNLAKDLLNDRDHAGHTGHKLERLRSSKGCAHVLLKAVQFTKGFEEWTRSANESS